MNTVGKGRTKAGDSPRGSFQGFSPVQLPWVDKVQEKKKKKASLSSLVHVQSKCVKFGLGNEGLLQPPFPLPFIANYLKFNLIHHFC